MMKQKSKIESWVHEFEIWVSTLEPIEGIPTDNLKQLKKQLNIRELPLPTRVHPGHTNSKLGLFKWFPPTVIHPIGSWEIEATVSSSTPYDIAIEIPRECFNKSDYLNHKYHIKRALYLSYLGVQLQTRGDSVNFCWPDGELLRPLLEVTLSGFMKIRMHFFPHEDLFNSKRFDPDTNNVRFEYFFNEKQSEDDPVYSTPIYNQAILADIMMLRNHEFMKTEISSVSAGGSTNNICEAIKLLKTWLEQRHLNQGYGSFSNFILTMFVCYLLRQQKISNAMSSYHIIRVVLVHLTQLDWENNGICMDAGVTEDELKPWFLQFDIVFLDSTRVFNFASYLSKYTYKRVKLEAKTGLNILNSTDIPGSQSLFFKEVPFSLSFDHLLQIRVTPALLKKVEEKPEYRSLMLSTSGHFFPVGVSILGQLIEVCLKKRIQLMDVEIAQPPVLPLTESRLPPELLGYTNIRFGVIINPAFAYKLVEKCESESEADVEAFTEFWGEKSQLRRFLDGTIVECVSFESEKTNMDNHICFLMLRYILKKHLGLYASEEELEVKEDDFPMGYYFDKQLERLIEPMFEKVSISTANSNQALKGKIKHDKNVETEPPKKKKKWKHKPKIIDKKITPLQVDEITKLATTSFDNLGKILRSMDDLPLSITSVQSTSPVIRYTNAFPTPPQTFYSSVLTITKADMPNCLLINEEISSPESLVIAKVPKYVDVIDVIVQLEGSGKWPDNINAIQRLKCAFLLKIGQLLQERFGLTTQVFPGHLYVIKDGFVFSIQLTYYREIILLKQLQGEDGILRLRDNLESLQQEKSTLLLPKLAGSLCALNNQYSSFGKVCRLAKRWISSQLLLASPCKEMCDLRQPDYCITEEAIELLVASLYLNYSPFLKPPNEAQVGFLRFLALLATTDWNSTAITVNFNDTLTRDEISSIETEFKKRRTALPTPFISYPDDKLHSVWTKNILPILWKRLVQLSQQALHVLTNHYRNNFCSIGYSRTSEESLMDPFRSIFNPDLTQFDIIIWVKRGMNSKRHWSLKSSIKSEQYADSESNSESLPMIPNHFKQEFKEYTKLRQESVPILEFDPVRLFVEELRQNFGHFGLFLYDILGGDYVAFVWKPDVLSESEFKISSAKGIILKDSTTGSNGKPATVPNVEGLIEHFSILGQGIVERIELKHDIVI